MAVVAEVGARAVTWRHRHRTRQRSFLSTHHDVDTNKLTLDVDSLAFPQIEQRGVDGAVQALLHDVVQFVKSFRRFYST